MCAFHRGDTPDFRGRTLDRSCGVFDPKRRNLEKHTKAIGNQWFLAPVLGGGCRLRGRWCAFRRGKTLDHSEVQIHLLPSSTCFPTPLPPSPGDPGRPKCDPPPSLEPPPSLPRTRDLTFSRYPFRLASHLRIPAQREPLDSPKTGWTLHRGCERGGRMCPFRRREPLHSLTSPPPLKEGHTPATTSSQPSTRSKKGSAGAPKGKQFAPTARVACLFLC